MSKKNKPLRAKLIANPGAGNISKPPHGLHKLRAICWNMG